MFRLNRRGKRLGVRLAATAMTLGLAACNSIFDTSRETRETARVQVTGTTTVPLLLVTSNQFIDVFDPNTGLSEVQILEADTLMVPQLPVDTTYSLGQFNQFLIQLINPSSQTARVRMVIRLDDQEEVYDEEADVTGSFLQYTYRVF